MKIKKAVSAAIIYMIMFLFIPILIFNVHISLLSFIFPYLTIIYVLGTVIVIAGTIKALLFDTKYLIMMACLTYALMGIYVYIVYEYSKIIVSGYHFYIMVSYFRISILVFVIIIARLIIDLLHYNSRHL
ncbi:MAG: hypothetical protein QXF41_03260 [Candidatus Micrarchaeaceae archaeon]